MKNRALIALVTVVIAVFGGVALTGLKQELAPSISFPQLAVISSYPGAAPEVVNDDVSTPIETAIQGVPGLETTSATSSTNSSLISASFAYGTDLAKGKETREIDGKQYVLEYPIHGDVALIKAEAGDRWGNLTYRMAARNFGPVMATAAKQTIATVHEIRELGQLDPEAIVTPGIYVSKIVKIDRVATQAGGFKKSA